MLMNKEAHEASKTIRVVINKKHKIKYSNIDNQEAIQYLEQLDVLEKLTENLPIEYSIGYYYVSIDKISIVGQSYYFITACFKAPECQNCKNILIDTATGLYNRNCWESIKSNISFYPKLQSFSLILIDIDNMKEINDMYGHLTGDKVIQIVGQAIKRSIRVENDLGIRYGGDEFIVLLSDQNDKAAGKVIERIREQIDKVAAIEGLNIQISAGVAYNDRLVNLEEMIEMADKNLYKEKDMKRGKKKQLEECNKLAKKIEEIRDKLNGKITKGDKILTSAEILELSQRLDKLIVEYLEWYEHK